MKYVLRTVAMVLALAGFSVSAQAAQKLKSDDVAKFVAAIPDVEAFSDQLEKEGKDKALEAAVKPGDNDKEFAPYGKGVGMLKEKFPDDYKKLNDAVAKQGFKKPEDWASTGDSVMMTYMAIKIEEQNPDAAKQLSEITPEMKAKMPPEALQQMERAQKMMKMVAAVPAANKEAVKPHMAGIDTWLQRSAEKEKAEAAAAAKAAGTPPAAAETAPAAPAEKPAH